VTLRVPPVPCPSCPYRRDVPSGVWTRDEYEKLRGYDDPQESFAPFHCHQQLVTGEETVCRGWLSVARESAAARIAVLEGRVRDEDRYDDVAVELWPTGHAAADHGERDVDNPGPEARAMIEKLGPRIARGPRR